MHKEFQEETESLHLGKMSNGIPKRECSAIPDRECSVSPDRECSASPDRECSASPDRESSVSPDRESSVSLNRERSASLEQKLSELSASDRYPWHMPGHKRNFCGLENPYQLDITEIDGFDDLHHAEGILKEAMEKTARIYHAKESFFMVNGSSGGILAAISAAAGQGGHIVMARNCHKSAYHAAFLRNLQVTWIYPDYEEEGFYGRMDPAQVREALYGRMDPAKVREALYGKTDQVRVKEDLCNTGPSAKEKEALCKPDISAVVLVSPTYEGIVSDIREIADICHEYGCPLIVDEAHGAHFIFGGQGEQDEHGEQGTSRFPLSAIQLGADLVIQSTHKTLPALTQTALLHVGQAAERYIDLKKLRFYLQIYQSSSPSYLFMASIEKAVNFMDSPCGREAMDRYWRMLTSARKKLEDLRFIKLYEPWEFVGNSFYDLSKLVLVMPADSEFDGGYLADRLRNGYHMEPEMNTDRYVILMTSVMDQEEGFERLCRALWEIDEDLWKRASCEKHGKISGGQEDSVKADGEKVPLRNAPSKSDFVKKSLPTQAPTFRMPSGEAFDRPLVWKRLDEAAGQISHDYVYIYPPGIPILIPGEEIEESILAVIRNWKEHGLDVRGTDGNRIAVVG